MRTNESTTLPMLYKNNPLDGTEFNNKFIFRSNEFINATQGIVEDENPISAIYRELTLNEQRLFMLTLLKMTPNLIDSANSNKPFELNVIPTSTMIQIFHGNKKYYVTLREAAAALYNLSIDLSDTVNTKSKIIGVNNFHQKRIFDEIKFGPDYGGLCFRFAEAVRPYLYDLYNKQYTKIAGRLIFSLKSTYGMRLLELLLQYQNINIFKQTGEIRRVFELDEFKRMFGLNNNKSYQQMGNLKNRVIKHAIDDIHKNTKYRIEYEDIKVGRSIKKFAFRMKLSPNEQNELENEIPTVETVVCDSVAKMHRDVNDERIALSAHLMCYGIGPRISKKLVQDYDAERIRSNIEYTLKQANIKNIAGYIRRAIEDNYVVSKPVQGKNKLDEKHEIFMKKLQEFGIGQVCGSLILNKLENNRPFTSQEEEWLKDSYIYSDSLREAFITNNPNGIVTFFDTEEYAEYVKEQEANMLAEDELEEFWKAYTGYEDDEEYEAMLKMTEAEMLKNSMTDAEFDVQYKKFLQSLTDHEVEMIAEPVKEENESEIKKTVAAKQEDIEDEIESLRRELGMAIACGETISRSKYTRAQELGLISALESLASLCEINLNDLVQ